jgi:hypothetical protein
MRKQLMPVFSLATPTTSTTVHPSRRSASATTKMKNTNKKMHQTHTAWFKSPKLRWQWEQYTNSLEFE